MNPASDLIFRYRREVKVLSRYLARRWQLDNEDIEQDLALVLLIDGSKFDPSRGGIWRWLYWKWQNLARRRNCLQLHSFESLEDLAQVTQSPLKAAANREQWTALKKAIDHLPARSRKIISLNFGLNGQSTMSLKTISQIEGISRQWASQCRNVGLKKLRQTMQEN